MPIDLTALVRESVAPADSGEAGLRATINGLLAERFTPDLPPWRLWLIHGHAPGEFATLFVAHHAICDGQSLIAIIRTFGAAAGTPMTHGDGETAGPVPPGRIVGPSPLAVVRGAASAMSSLLPPAARLGPPALHGNRDYHWAFTPADTLRKIADGYVVTVNDILLATLSGVLRDWRGSPWHDLSRRGRRLWCLMPMSARDDVELSRIGNRVSFVRVALPCGEPDPVRRIRLIAAQTAKAKAGGRRAAGAAFGRGAPTWLARAIVKIIMSPRFAHVVAANVGVGFDGTVSLGGRPMRALAPVMGLPAGRPLQVAFVTCQNDLAAGLVADARIAGTEELPSLWGRAVDELELAL